MTFLERQINCKILSISIKLCQQFKFPDILEPLDSVEKLVHQDRNTNCVSYQAVLDILIANIWCLLEKYVRTTLSTLNTHSIFIVSRHCTDTGELYSSIAFFLKKSRGKIQKKISSLFGSLSVSVCMNLFDWCEIVCVFASKHTLFEPDGVIISNVLDFQ